MNAKGLRIKVLSGSFPDRLLDLDKDAFLLQTVPLHSNEPKKVKVMTDLWKNANKKVVSKSQIKNEE